VIISGNLTINIDDTIRFDISGTGSSQFDSSVREPVVARQRKHAPTQILVAKPSMSRLGRDDCQAVPGLNLTCDAGLTKRGAQ
jgi:hypothetical protein